MNPFKFGNIVYGEYFYNREDELLRIKRVLSDGNNITLYAPRRYGKTSLVKKALAELENEGFNTVYIDFMKIYSREKFIENYTSEIVNKNSSSIDSIIAKVAKFVSGIVPSLSFDNSGNPKFSLAYIQGQNTETTLIDSINLPEKLASDNQKWIIAFDEFQEITNLNGDSFEKILRSEIQHQKNVSYIFFGSKTHLIKDMFNNKNRAFYNASMIMTINKIKEEKSIDFLVERFQNSGVSLTNDIAKYILQKVENIPYYIQFIAYEIWQFMIVNNQKTITNDIVNDAFDRVLDIKNDYYWELTNKQTNYRKKVLKALASSSKEIFSHKVSQEFSLGATSSTQKAIDVFINDGIIEKSETNYEFSDPIFKEFIINKI